MYLGTSRLGRRANREPAFAERESGAALDGGRNQTRPSQVGAGPGSDAKKYARRRGGRKRLGRAAHAESPVLDVAAEAEVERMDVW